MCSVSPPALSPGKTGALAALWSQVRTEKKIGVKVWMEIFPILMYELYS
jgi:hypothetical protein